MNSGRLFWRKIILSFFCCCRTELNLFFLYIFLSQNFSNKIVAASTASSWLVYFSIILLPFWTTFSGSGRGFYNFSAIIMKNMLNRHVIKFNLSSLFHVVKKNLNKIYLAPSKLESLLDYNSAVNYNKGMA